MTNTYQGEIDFLKWKLEEATTAESRQKIQTQIDLLEDSIIIYIQGKPDTDA